jgi:hypothetical protein
MRSWTTSQAHESCERREESSYLETTQRLRAQHLDGLGPPLASGRLPHDSIVPAGTGEAMSPAAPPRSAVVERSPCAPRLLLATEHSVGLGVKGEAAQVWMDLGPHVDVVGVQAL